MSYQSRKIYFCDEINEESTFKFVNFIDRFLSMDEKIGCKEPIEIHINSVGGMVYYGLTIISTIERMKSLGYKIITYNIGLCASMAFPISLCGSERRTYEYSRYMYHDISCGFFGKLKQTEDDIIETRNLREEIDNIVIKYSKIKIEDIEDWRDRKLDKFFSSKLALELGIADVVE